MKIESGEIDPWIDRGVNQESLNLYRVDDGDPINESDPNGLSPVPQQRLLLTGGPDNPDNLSSAGSGWVVKPNGTLVEVPDANGNPAILAWAQGYVNAVNGVYAPAVKELVGNGPVDPYLAAYIYMGEALENAGYTPDQIGGISGLTGAAQEVQDWLHDQQSGVVPMSTFFMAGVTPSLHPGDNPMNSENPESMNENAKAAKIRSGLAGESGPAAEKKPIDSSRPQHFAAAHDATAFNQAAAWESDPNTIEARFNQNLVDVNGNEVPGFRPDAQRIRTTPSGRVVDVVEVQSRSQTDAFMDQKVAAMKKALGSQAGDIIWVPPEKNATRDGR